MGYLIGGRSSEGELGRHLVLCNSPANFLMITISLMSVSLSAHTSQLHVCRALALFRTRAEVAAGSVHPRDGRESAGVARDALATVHSG